MPKLNALIAGSTGYIGVQLVKLLIKHPNINIKYLCGNTSEGKSIYYFDRSLKNKKLPKIIKFNNKLLNDVDLVFTALPNGESQKISNKLLKKNILIDLSADFRLNNAKEYLKWYKIKHSAKNNIKNSIYALPELSKSKLKNYETKGLKVLAATEMEFHLIDESKNSILPPINPISKKRLSTPDILGISELDCFEDFFTDLQDSCEQMGINVQSIISESGCGQFEVTLKHCEALKASDDAWLFKSLAKGLARKHGMAATFMAKPYLQDAGNGMHIHFSILNLDGDNIFDNKTNEGSEVLRWAVAGCLEGLRGSTLIFAPFGNSYKRFVKNAHAPTSAQWGYENRTTAIRIPGGDFASKRIEHRVAGGDTNPYLAMAVVLGSALLGIENKLKPARPVSNNGYSNRAEELAESWKEAIDCFENDPFIKK